MFKVLFDFFLIIHILGDFYFQSDKLAIKKRDNYKYVLRHSIYYSLVSIICILPFWSVEFLISVVSLSMMHFLIDSVKFFYTMKKVPNATIYAADQLIHLTCITVAASILTYKGYDLKLLSMIKDFLLKITNNPQAILGWIGFLLMASKPINVTIKQLVGKYKPLEYKSDIPNNAGAFIGTLERIIILLLLSVGQYAAIGLVLTAKSVARYNKISEDKQFAEYYLLGTLLSALLAISTYFIFS